MGRINEEPAHLDSTPADHNEDKKTRKYKITKVQIDKTTKLQNNKNISNTNNTKIQKQR